MDSRFAPEAGIAEVRLSSAVVRLLGAPPPNPAPPDPSVPSSSVGPAQQLADVIDLRGAVALARHLAELEAPAPPATVPWATLRARHRAGVVEVQRRLEDAFAHMFKARYRLPGPERALQLLAETGALGHRKGAPLQQASRALWAPCHDFLDTQLKRARFALRDLRAELGPGLGGLSPAAARIERLDRGLEVATQVATEALLARGMVALEARFAADLRARVRLLPPEITATGGAALAATWGTGPEVWLAPTMALGQAWVRALVARDVRRLQALVDAAVARRC